MHIDCTVPAKREVVYVSKRCHEYLAVKAVHHASVARDDVSKVLQRQSQLLHSFTKG